MWLNIYSLKINSVHNFGQLQTLVISCEYLCNTSSNLQAETRVFNYSFYTLNQTIGELWSTIKNSFCI